LTNDVHYQAVIISEKLFQTGNIEVVRLAQRMFGFVLPSFLVEKRSNKFCMVK